MSNRETNDTELMHIPNNTEEVIKISVAIWKLERKVLSMKNNEQIDQDVHEKISNSINYIQGQLNQLKLELSSREGQKYNEGMNIDVIAREGNSEDGDEYIKETIEPQVSINGKLVKKERVIVSYGK